MKAQHIPDFGDSLLNKKIEEFLPKKVNDKDKYYRLVTIKSYKDTIFPIFSQFVLGGSNIFAKNANVLTSELSTKDTRIGYNMAAYKHIGFKGIFNAELFASGKDNIAKVFGNAKFQGNFGINLSGSFLLHSGMFFLPSDANALLKKKIDYYWLIKQKGATLLDTKKKSAVEREIDKVRKELEQPTIYFDADTYKSKLFGRLIALEDSLKKFMPLDSLSSYYDRETVIFEKKHAKWTGFNLWTLDLRAGIANEGFNHYVMIDNPVIYPVVSENATRFNRTYVGLNLNYLRNSRWLSMKATGGLTLTRFIGFDSESAEEITESKKYDSVNVTRSFEKKYSAYKFKEDIENKFYGMVYNAGIQSYFGKTKSFGLGATTAFTDFFGGPDNGDVAIDNVYNIFFAISKRGDVLNKNVISINFRTPDLTNKLEKSFNSLTGEKKGWKKKLEVGISFGITLDKILHP